jgi:hypothetical protein
VVSQQKELMVGTVRGVLRSKVENMASRAVPFYPGLAINRGLGWDSGGADWREEKILFCDKLFLVILILI